MSAALIPAWRPEDALRFGKSPIKFRHAFGASGLFDDEALAELLDRYPADLFDINLFSFDRDGQMSLRAGARGTISGREVLQGVKEGRLWLQLRAVQANDAAIGALITRAFEGISDQVPGFKPVNLTGQLIISAPQAKVPFHADAPGVVLFHIRGRKRLWVYPADERHVSQRSMEAIMLKAQTEDLPYSLAMDAGAEVVDLDPGEALSWPLHAPHRVENLDAFNVSLSVDYQTWASRILNGAHYTNGLMRKAGLPVAPMSRTPSPARLALWAASLGLKRLNLVPDKVKAIERSFELDGRPAHEAA
jgi:hypothetical protein